MKYNVGQTVKMSESAINTLFADNKELGNKYADMEGVIIEVVSYDGFYIVEFGDGFRTALMDNEIIPL